MLEVGRGKGLFLTTEYTEKAREEEGICDRGDVATEGTVLFVGGLRQKEPSPLSLAIGEARAVAKKAPTEVEASNYEVGLGDVVCY